MIYKGEANIKLLTISTEPRRSRQSFRHVAIIELFIASEFDSPYSKV